jgi:hypothetical protein
MMKQESRRRLLLKAIHDAASELATRASRARSKSDPQIIAISALDIFELIRPTVPNVTLDEVENIIMQSLPYMGGPRQ